MRTFMQGTGPRLIWKETCSNMMQVWMKKAPREITSIDRKLMTVKSLLTTH